jgi:hypothetical protein
MKMNTGNKPKSGLAAGRIALLAGVSAAVLGFAGSANAQTYEIDVTAPGGVVPLFNGNAQITTIDASGAYTSSLINGNVYTAGPGGAFTNIASSVLNQAAGSYSTQLSAVSGLNVTDGTNTSTVSATGISSAFNGGSFNADGGYVTIYGNTGTNTGTVANLTFSNAAFAVNNGGAWINNGLNVSGGTQTDTLKVTGTSQFGGLATFNNGTTTNGTATFNGTGGNAGTNTQINGAVATLNGSQGTITLNANVDPVVTVSNAAGTNKTTINNGSITTQGAGSGITVLNAAGTAPQFVANSSGLISAEGNRIEGVATPILGTDAANKAYVDRGVNRAFEGTAVALAISQPVFLPGQTFAIRAGWGDYQGQNAAGVAAAGVIAHDVFGYGSTVTLDAGIGVGTTYNDVGGKAGVTFGFGGGAAPLK